MPTPGNQLTRMMHRTVQRDIFGRFAQLGPDLWYCLLVGGKKVEQQLCDCPLERNSPIRLSPAIRQAVVVRLRELEFDLVLLLECRGSE